MKPIDRHGVFATKPLRAIFLGLTLYGTLAWLPSTAFAASETPIFAFTAYREFKDVAERPIEPSATMIIDAQSRFIALLDQRLQESGDTAEIADVSSKKSLIEALVDDLVLANALLIDVLIESPAVEVESRIVSIHHAMRWKYVLEIEVPDFALEPGTFSKGIPLGVAEELEDNGIDVIYLTNAATADYTAECEAAGVPIPPPMFAEPWVNRESFDGEEFESVAEDPELWVYLSEDSNGKQDGISLALPRYNDENKAKLFGIICLGLETSNAPVATRIGKPGPR